MRRLLAWLGLLRPARHALRVALYKPDPDSLVARFYRHQDC